MLEKFNSYEIQSLPMMSRELIARSVCNPYKVQWPKSAVMPTALLKSSCPFGLCTRVCKDISFGVTCSGKLSQCYRMRMASFFPLLFFSWLCPLLLFLKLHIPFGFLLASSSSFWFTKNEIFSGPCLKLVGTIWIALVFPWVMSLYSELNWPLPHQQRDPQLSSWAPNLPIDLSE